ncbi:hypothetical protein ACFE04_012773 [Oxalis oulophora]
MGDFPEDLSDSSSSSSSSIDPNNNININVNYNEQRVYFVPLRWWIDAQDAILSTGEGEVGRVGVGEGVLLYTASSASSSYAGPMKLINNIFNSDLIFNLKREDDHSHTTAIAADVPAARDFALVSGDMWLQALKWHSDAKIAAKGGKSFSAAEDDMGDVYPLQLRLSVIPETISLGVKISKKDNTVELFRRACKIFSIESDMLRIWDFSGQTSLFFINDKSRLPKDYQRPSDQEVLLHLQVYGLSDSTKCSEGKKDDSSVNANGASHIKRSYSNGFLYNDTSTHSGRFIEAGSLGLAGLQNLGNTCFMNSALQCLAHTPKLVDYFLGDYAKEINHDNPLGMEGEIALAFGDLLRKLWAPGASSSAPRTFKSKLARFAPQFSGFNQHDSQELLAFLLDGLHEDLNRVKCKPYVEAKDGDDRPDEEIADEYWRNHLARNDSIIVDVCQGQYKSTLVCPICRKVSITFDPFMYLSLPLPSTTLRTMTLTVVSSDGSSQPSQYTINVPKNGKSEDLIQALSTSCSLGVDETLLVAEIYNHRIIRYLEEPSDALSLIRDEDRLFDLYEVLVFKRPRSSHGALNLTEYINGQQTPTWKTFGIPLVTQFCDANTGSDIYNQYIKLMSPFQLPTNDISEIDNPPDSSTTEEIGKSEDKKTLSSEDDENALGPVDADLSAELELHFYLTDDKGAVKERKMLMDEPLAVTGSPKRLNVIACWPEKHIGQYDIHLLSTLPEIFKTGFFSKKPQESVTLYKCLEAFLKEEPLGPDDMWYCPGCKEHRQASKKLDLWRLPEILVIHLKRFSYSRFFKNKLETYVDFPVEDLDLSTYIAYKNGSSSHRYTLYAISNHYGSMGGGHYTAFVHHGGDQWYDFNDNHVYPISQDKIKSSSAYLLFYRRVAEN